MISITYFSLIKELLYHKGFTITGARQQLKIIKKSVIKAETPEKVEKEEAIMAPQIATQKIDLAPVLSATESTVQPAVVEKIIVEYIPRIPEHFIQTVKTAREKLLQIRSSLE